MKLWKSHLKFIVMAFFICMPLLPSCLAGLEPDVGGGEIEGVGETGDEGETEGEGEAGGEGEAEGETGGGKFLTASLNLVRLDGTELELGAIPIPRAVRIKVTFDRAVEEGELTEIENSFILKQGDISLGKSFSWSADYTEVTVTPDSWFDYHTTYTLGIIIEVETFVTSVAKDAVADEINFTTATRGDADGDGNADVIVGASRAPQSIFKGLGNNGQAYVFTGTGVLVATITGEDRGEATGLSVSVAGDVNADGFADIVIGAPHAETKRGRVYVFLGSGGGIGDCDLSLPPADPDACTPHATLIGSGVDYRFGFSVSGAGDVNGDGYDDIIVGEDIVEDNIAGRAYVFHGSGKGIIQGQTECDLSAGCVADATITGAMSTPTPPSAPDPGPFFKILLPPGDPDDPGVSVSGAGDVNGDGYDDVIVGSYEAGRNGGKEGQAYILLGSKEGITPEPECDMSVFPPCKPHATVTGESAGEHLGISVSGAGDVNGDGKDDIIVGAFFAEAKKGKAYVLLGPVDEISVCSDCKLGTAISTAIPDATITGKTAVFGGFLGDRLGYTVSGAGDVDGDGCDDIIVGARFAESYKGQAYVFYGSKEEIGSCDLSADPPDDCTPYATITGEVDDDYLGSSVFGVGDVNGDGFDDLLVGALDAEGGKGQAYIFLGSEGGFIPDPDVTFTGVDVNGQLGTVR